LCVLAIGLPSSGVFNAGSGLGISIGEVIALLARILGRDIDLIHKEAREFDASVNVLDIKKSCTRLTNHQKSCWKKEFNQLGGGFKLLKGINNGRYKFISIP
jgi:UDP-glucose 4-epimerase